MPNTPSVFGGLLVAAVCLSLAWIVQKLPGPDKRKEENEERLIVTIRKG